MKHNTLLLRLVLLSTTLLFMCGNKNTTDTKLEFMSIINLQVSPDETRIAFIGYGKRFRKNVYITGIATGITRKIISANEFSWTRDGRAMVIATRMGLYHLNLIDGTQTELLKNKSHYFAHRVHCNPTTDEVLFISSFVDKNPEVYKINYLNGKKYRLTSNQHEEDFPLWSPDGKKITYLSNHMPYIMNADGDNKTIVLDKLSDAQPIWSPGNNRLALTMLVSKESNTNTATMDRHGNIKLFKKNFIRSVFIMNADGSDFEELTEGFEPQWTSDGESIVFKFTSGGSSPHLYAYHLKTQKFTPLFPEIVDSTYSVSYPVSFPYSNQLAFVCQGIQAMPNGMAIVNTDGTGYRRIFSF